MDTKVLTTLPSKNASSAVLMAVADKANAPFATLSPTSKKAVTALVKRGELPTTANKCLMLHDVAGFPAPRLLLIRTGKVRQDRPSATIVAQAEAIAAAVQDAAFDQLVIVLDDTLCPAGVPKALAAQILATTLSEKLYQFSAHPRTDKAKAHPIKTLSFVVDDADKKSVQRGAKQGAAIAAGMAITKDLGNLAPNICTPDYLAKTARSLAKNDKNMKVTVLGEPQMKKLGMGAFLAVSQGSRQAARLIAMDYRGGKSNQKPIVLVGKGVTFDTGGISIKPSAEMDEMKFDMCGAASVFGVMEAVQRLKLKVNVVGVVAAAENMPDGDACRPGDVITTLSGQSVEILNTDAEGRLVLCDTLTWIERYKPAAVVDMATLTGACIIALGHVCSAVLGNDEELVNALVQAGQTSSDTTWALPMWEDYQSQLDSNFADMGNIGGRAAGTITAACFLSRFSTAYPWAHLDIAGVAWNSGAKKGATGRPVPLLMTWLMDQVA